MKYRPGRLLVIFIAVPLMAAGLMPLYPSLPDSLSSPNFSYIIHYTNNNPYNPASPPPSPDLDYMPDGQAQRMVDAANNSSAASAGNPNGYHVGYINMGFQAPNWTSTNRDMYTFTVGCGCDSGNAPADAIQMPATSYISASERCIRSVVGHEMFHHVQFAYITFGKWPQWAMPLEGTARMMQDKVFSDLDSWDAAGCCCGYVGENTGYLANPNRTIWDLTYPTSLWWTYLSEQLGSTSATEPSGGSDFVVKLWQRAQANNDPPDVEKAVREAIALFTSSRSLENLFQDFTIANYTKQLDLSSAPTPSRFRYRDENDGNSLVFGDVPVISATLGTAGTVGVLRWGARYLEAAATNCPAGGVIGFQGTGDAANYALVGIKGTNRVTRILKSNSTASHALLQRSGSDAYTTLGAVITGTNISAGTIDFLFDCGSIKMSIREPALPEPIAYVGPLDAPERFLIKVRVSGPATLGSPSVEGLKTSDFRAYVGAKGAAADEADILSGSYVQGDYWLVAQAPEKAPGSASTYNLFVQLWDGSEIASAGAEAVVYYASRQVDQMLVIDRSGSMSEPAGAPKITAAKAAAALYVDSARSTDQTGVVSFTGDTVETNTDATRLYPLTLMSVAGARSAAKTAIDSIVSDGWTSIGDGLEVGDTELMSVRGRPVPPTERWIVLLSDGMENEAKYWADVRSTLQTHKIKVNAIALGPTTDQPLLQSIAADTGGLYYYVDPPPATAAAVGPGQAAMRAPAAGLPPLLVQLGNAYALAAERVQNHERIREERVVLSPNGTRTVSIPIKEGGITDALFSIAWSGGIKNVQVDDPLGNPVRNGVGGALVFVSGNHATFRVPVLADGSWDVTLSDGGGGSDVLVILSGVNKQGAQMRLFFGAYGGAQYPFSTNQFLVGQTMPILVSLTDRKGAVLGARVSAEVEHPDGSLDPILLYDDGGHQDGGAGDGVYGGFYYRTTQGSRTGRYDEGKYSKRGSYNVVVTATGEDNLGDTFTRVARGSFNVYEPVEQTVGDTDKDGLIDLYEKQHSCLDYLTADSSLDPDLDRLTSLEEFSAGLNPCDADTDSGGEMDGSEVKRGANPLHPVDDALPKPVDAGVISQVSNDLRPHPPLKSGANLIRYPAHAAYRWIRLFRATSPDGPFTRLPDFDSPRKPDSIPTKD